MGITYGDHLIDIGYQDITPEQEREIEAREECARRGIDPDAECADGGTVAWMVVDQERRTPSPERESLSNELDPEIGFPSDYLLRCIHADLEIRGRKNPDFAVTVHHRNIVLSAVANALRSSSLLTWDEWHEHCGWPPVGWQWRFKKEDGEWSDWNDGKARQWVVDGTKEYQERPLYAVPVAREIAVDAVISWMVEHQWLDAGNEYGTGDIIAALNDNAGPGAFSDELARIKGIETQLADLLRLSDVRNQSLRHWRDECGKLHSQIGKLKDEAEAERERAERLLAHKDRQAAASRKYWLRAAKAALDGDPRELRNRVELAEADPVELVLSNE